MAKTALVSYTRSHDSPQIPTYVHMCVGLLTNATNFGIYRRNVIVNALRSFLLLPPTTISVRHSDFHMGQHWALANLDGKTKTRVYPGKGFWQLGRIVFDMLRPRKLVTATDVQVETRGAVMQRQPHWR